MPNWGYSITGVDPDRTVKASGRELRVSPKRAREVCNTIKGMRLEQAKAFLQQVILKRRVIPFRRYKRKVGHRRGVQKAFSGRYPIKAARRIIEVLENAEANAEYMGLGLEGLRIIHAAAYPGVKIRNYIPRAFGRTTPYFKHLCHVEVVLEQTEET